MMFTLLKGLVKSLKKQNGDLGKIFACNKDGPSVLHLAAYQGHLEVCKYLVEDLGGDANAPGHIPGVGGFSLTFSHNIHIWRMS